MIRSVFPNSPTTRRFLRQSLRVLAPALAGIAIALEAGALGTFRKDPVAAPDGAARGGFVPAPVILGTRG